MFFFSDIRSKYPAIALYLILVFASIAMTAAGRFYFLDIQFSQSPRYTFYSSQIIALLAAISVIYLRQWKLGWPVQLSKIIAIASIIACISSYAFNLERIRAQQLQLLRGMWLWNTQQRDRPFALLIANPVEILNNAQRLGLYQPPAISHLPPDQWGHFNNELTIKLGSSKLSR